MTLAPGSTLATYRILGPLGAGAMGEVYRARDTRLEREVAIKVLPENFATDEERLRRFEREAKTLASLNHPNIAQIFGVDQIGDTCFLVLELVPGETLEDHLKRGPSPVDEAIDFCRQIAEGLEAAHEAGVIHRDLKPANVRITPEGQVKLLDFGLAKPMRAGESRSSDSVLATEQGRLLGTPTYMAPEQARGKSIDRRVDIWAFGCVLFECLTGTRAFEGETLSDVLAAVLHAQPDLTKLPRETPFEVRDLVARCLEKDVRQRLRDAGDARIVLERARTGAASREAAPRAAPARTRAAMHAAWAIVAVLLCAAGAFLGHRRAPVVNQVVRSSIQLPTDLFLPEIDGSLAIAPDGRTLALVGGRTSDPKSHLWLRTLDSLAPQALAGTDGASYPFWAPDGRTLAFFAEGKLKRIPGNGGTVTTICDAADGRGGTWSSAGTIVFAPKPFGPLERVPASGGKPVVVTQASGGESHRLPHFLPDGHRVLYTKANTSDDGILLLDLASGASTRVTDDKSEGLWVPPGELLFVRANNLVAQPFDAQAGRLAGEPRLIAEQVLFNPLRFAGTYAVSDEGTLVYQSMMPLQRLEAFDFDGRSLGRVGDVAHFAKLALSPDGKRAATILIRNDGKLELWIYDTEHWRGSRLAEDLGGLGLVWSPDSLEIAYPRREGTDIKTFVRACAGSTEERSLCNGWPSDWSRDGKWIAIWSQEPGTGFDLSCVRADGTEGLRTLLASPAREFQGVFSPDGRWLLFDSDQSGREELYAMPFPGPGPLRPVDSNEVGVILGWLDDGRVVYENASQRELFTVEVKPRGDDLEIGVPRQVFSGRAMPPGTISVSFARDGKQILAVLPADEGDAGRLTLVQNWPDAR